MFNDEDDEEATMGAVRYPVMPSLVALQQMRNRLHLAYLGKKLMKWTAMATSKELRRIAIEISNNLKEYGTKIQLGFILLARARYFVPHINTTVLECIPKCATITVRTQPRSVSGVKVRNLYAEDSDVDPYPYLGLNNGGMCIASCKELWEELVKLMILIVQYKITFVLIEQAHKAANKKQNVLSRCIIPRILITMHYILSELDEREREETFRLKRFKQLKYKGKKPEDKTPVEREDYVPAKKPATAPCQVCAVEEPPPKPAPVPPKVEAKKEIPCAPAVETFTCPLCQMEEDEDSTLRIRVCKQGPPRTAPPKDRLEHLVEHINQLIQLVEQLTAEQQFPCGRKHYIMKCCEGMKFKIEELSSPPPPCDFCKDAAQQSEQPPPQPPAPAPCTPAPAPCDVCMSATQSVAASVPSTPRPCDVCSTAPPPPVPQPLPKSVPSTPPPCEVCMSAAEQFEQPVPDPRPLPISPCATFPASVTSSCIPSICGRLVPSEKVSKTAPPCHVPDASSQRSVLPKGSTISKQKFKLGYFETEYKEIVRVTRSLNPDGTLSEEKQIITVKTERTNPRRKGKKGNTCSDEGYATPCRRSDSDYGGGGGFSGGGGGTTTTDDNRSDKDGGVKSKASERQGRDGTGGSQRGTGGDGMDGGGKTVITTCSGGGRGMNKHCSEGGVCRSESIHLAAIDYTGSCGGVCRAPNAGAPKSPSASSCCRTPATVISAPSAPPPPAPSSCARCGATSAAPNKAGPCGPPPTVLTKSPTCGPPRPVPAICGTHGPPTTPSPCANCGLPPTAPRTPPSTVPGPTPIKTIGLPPPNPKPCTDGGICKNEPPPADTKAPSRQNSGNSIKSGKTKTDGGARKPGTNETASKASRSSIVIRTCKDCGVCTIRESTYDSGYSTGTSFASGSQSTYDNCRCDAVCGSRSVVTEYVTSICQSGEDDLDGLRKDCRTIGCGSSFYHTSTFLSGFNPHPPGFSYPPRGPPVTKSTSTTLTFNNIESTSGCACKASTGTENWKMTSTSASESSSVVSRYLSPVAELKDFYCGADVPMCMKCVSAATSAQSCWQPVTKKMSDKSTFCIPDCSTKGGVSSVNESLVGTSLKRGGEFSMPTPCSSDASKSIKARSLTNTSFSIEIASKSPTSCTDLDKDSNIQYVIKGCPLNALRKMLMPRSISTQCSEVTLVSVVDSSCLCYHAKSATSCPKCSIRLQNNPACYTYVELRDFDLENETCMSCGTLGQLSTPSATTLTENTANPCSPSPKTSQHSRSNSSDNSLFSECKSICAAIAKQIAKCSPLPQEICCPKPGVIKTLKVIPKQIPIPMLDAMTSTKRCDRFDCRPLLAFNNNHTCAKIRKEVCACHSDSHVCKKIDTCAMIQQSKSCCSDLYSRYPYY